MVRIAWNRAELHGYAMCYDMGMTKYGVRYSTILYWQSSAKEYTLYNGKPYVYLNILNRYLANDTTKASVIAHAAIQAAMVNASSRVKDIIVFGK